MGPHQNFCGNATKPTHRALKKKAITFHLLLALLVTYREKLLEKIYILDLPKK